MITLLWVFFWTNILLVVFLASGAMLTWMVAPKQAMQDTYGIGDPDDTTLAVHEFHPVLHVFLRNTLLLPTLIIIGVQFAEEGPPPILFDAMVIAWVVLVLWFFQEHKKFWKDPETPGGDTKWK